MPRFMRQEGQATVEMVALLPLVAVLLAAVWQGALAGHARWAAAGAARAAARAQAVGADPRAAARARLPRALERDLRVDATGTGEIELSIRVPGFAGLPSPGRLRARGHFDEQS
jgi:hypothetical protein